MIFTLKARAAPPPLAWLAYGDLRGHLEPCGCDPATDLGGVRRLIAVLDRERRPEVGVFSLGNDLPVEKDQEVKIPFLLEWETLAKPTAMLLNVLELQDLAAVGRVSGKVPLVLSNAKGPAAKVAAPRIETELFTVFGLTLGERVKGQVEPLSRVLLARIKAERRPGKRTVLLFAGGDTELAEVVQSGIFDVIISANTADWAKEPGDQEKRHPELLVRRKEPQVLMVPLGGQGILRGGVMQNGEAKSALEVLSEAKNPGGPALPGLAPAGALPSTVSGAAAAFGEPTLVTWLDNKAGSAARAEELFQRYAQATKAKFAKAGEERLRDLRGSPFAGAQACASCHPKQTEIYNASRHSHAMATLVAKGKEQDGECVACHSVGAKAKGGFVSLAASPQLANVQCENCHGPRKEHVARPTAKMAGAASAKDACVSCHSPQHSPAFDFAKYWPRIQH